MYIHHRLDSRSSGETSNSGGSVQGNTIIFIFVGVVCLCLLLIGFCFVSHHRSRSNPATSTPGPHSPNTANAHLQRRGSRRDSHQRWKIWKISPSGTSTQHATPEPQTSQVSLAPATLAIIPLAVSATSSSGDHPLPPPPVVSMSKHSRRVSSLSVETSFSHSHVTQEALRNYHASGYDLDTDLVIEMMHSARDERGPAYPFEGNFDHAGGAEEDVGPIPEDYVTADTRRMHGTTTLPQPSV